MSQKSAPTTIKILAPFVRLHLSQTEVPRAETLIFLPGTTQANLVDVGNSLDRDVVMSQRDTEISTEASWQAHYILWSRIMGIPDPCVSEPGYERIVGIYIKFLQYGVNYTNKDGLRATTLVGYAKAILILFTLRGFPSPVNLSDPNNTGGIIIMNHKREEDITVQR